MSFINIIVIKIINRWILTVLFFVTIIITSSFAQPVYASSSPPIFLDNSSQAANYLACPDIECSDNPGECANSQNLNNCGLPTCGGGDAWTKYNKVGCGRLPGDECNSLYSPGDKVYSIGDKCTSGGPYLNPGYCESAFGGPIYKTCCRNPEGGISPSACEPFDADSAGDPEGRCPAGYEREVFCGGAGEPPCGQEACGAPPPSEPPPPTPTQGEPPPPTPTPAPICVANSWDSTLCAKCKADGSGYNASCSDFGPNSPSPGNDWCSCDQRCPGADNPACSSSFTVSCSASPNPASTNQSVTWTGAPNPTGTYTYAWSDTAITGATNTANPGNVLSFSKSYAASGTKTAKITATRSSDGISAQNSCTADINTPSNCDITSASLNPVTWNSTTSAFNYTQINWTTSGKNGSKLFYYNPGTCSQSSCPASGWDLLTSAGSDGSFGHVWNPNPQSPAQGSTHTIGLTGSDNILCDTYNISFGTQSTCTLTASPASDTASPYATTLSASVVVTGMPPSKQSQWDCNGDGTFEFEDAAISHSCTYGSTGTYNPAFRVVDAPGSSTVLSRCSTSFTAGTAPPPGGPTPTPPPSCSPEAPPNNAPTVTLRSDGHTVDIVYVYGLPEEDDSDTEGVSTQRITPDNPIQNLWLKLMEFFKARLTFGAATPPDIRGTIYRSDKRGFIDTGISKTQTGTQFGSYGFSIDRNPPSHEEEARIAYYQLQINSGDQTKYSNTSGALIRKEGYRNCTGVLYYSLPSLVSATRVSSTTTTVTFNLQYDVGPGFTLCDSGSPDDICYPTYTPAYLQIQRPYITTRGYIPWVNGTNPTCMERRRISGDYHCVRTRWTAGYTVDLPPDTTENLTIQGYSGPNKCDWMTAGGTVPLAASTQPDTTPQIIVPRLSTQSYVRDKENDPVVPMSWEETQNGQVVKVYRSNNQRWDGDQAARNQSSTFEGRNWVFRATDDLETIPRGQTYYYGIELNMRGVVGTECNGYRQGEYAQSNQAGIYWDYAPWIKTTGGDVHSQEGINTPGGP